MQKAESTAIITARMGNNTSRSVITGMAINGKKRWDCMERMHMILRWMKKGFHGICQPAS